MGGSTVGIHNTSHGEIIYNKDGGVDRVSQKVNGIDLDEILKGPSEVIRAEAKPKEVKIEKDTAMRADLLKFKGMVKEVETLVHVLSNPLGPSSTSTTNYFKRAQVAGFTSDGKPVKDSVIANSTNSSEIGSSYRIKVTQLATKDKINGTVDYTDAKTGLGLSGTLTINGTDITITDGSGSTANMSLTDIANAIKSAGVKVSAEAVSKTGTDDYYLALSSQEFAKPLAISDGGSGVMALLGLAASSGQTVDNLSAKIWRDVNPDGSGGTELTRTTNDGLNDVIPGVLDLKTADNSRVITLNFKEDKSGIIEAFEHLREKWNELDAFYKEKTLPDPQKPGEAAEEATLYGQSLPRTLHTQMKAALVKNVPSSKGGGEVTSLVNFGIKIESDGTLSVDRKKLEEGIADNFEDLKRAAGNHVNSTNTRFQIFQLPKTLEAAISDVPITVTYNKDGAGVETATLVYGATTINISGDDVSDGLIKGPEGTIFEGLRIGYNTVIGEAAVPNNTNDTSTVTMVKGALADLDSLYNQYTQGTTGLIDKELTAVDAKNLKLQKDIDKIQARADKELNRMLNDEQGILAQIMQYQQFDKMLESMIQASKAA